MPLFYSLKEALIMTYKRKANPNATNSELDSKRIITHKELTSAQRDELIEQFVEIQLDNMDTQSLYELASEYVTNSFDRLTDSEIKERIESLYDEELYEELVDNVTQQYPKQLNTYEKEVFLDVNNTGGKY